MYFEYATPEEVGIPSEKILDFLTDVSLKGIEQHSLMIIRHGKCCAAGWWDPYKPEYLHPVYSFSKSLTATAIGFAEQEGLLSLDEKLADLFPDLLPEHPSENLLEINLHHLLTMSCGHETEIRDPSENWIRSFLAHPVLHKPGTFYKYNSVGTDMLSAVLKKKTGENITDFLRPRLLDPLGIENILCAKHPDGVESGGGGMKLTTEDMAKFTYFMLHKGEWEGKQLLNKAWFERASQKQIETAGDSEGHVKEWANGYGYQCWMGSLPESFRADGAYGQFGFVYPTLDMIVVTTNSTEQTQSLVDSMTEHLLPFVQPAPLAPSEEAEYLAGWMDDLMLLPLAGDRCPAAEEKLHGQIYASTAEESSENCSIDYLIGGAGLFHLNTAPITQMSFTCRDDLVIWKIWDEENCTEISASLDQEFTLSSSNGITYAASARWRSFMVLEMEVRRVDAISGARIIFRFVEDTLTIDADDTLVSAGGLGIYPRHLAPFVTL